MESDNRSAGGDEGGGPSAKSPIGKRLSRKRELQKDRGHQEKSKKQRGENGPPSYREEMTAAPG